MRECVCYSKLICFSQHPSSVPPSHPQLQTPPNCHFRPFQPSSTPLLGKLHTHQTSNMAAVNAANSIPRTHTHPTPKPPARRILGTLSQPISHSASLSRIRAFTEIRTLSGRSRLCNPLPSCFIFVFCRESTNCMNPARYPVQRRFVAYQPNRTEDVPNAQSPLHAPRFYRLTISSSYGLRYVGRAIEFVHARFDCMLAMRLVSWIIKTACTPHDQQTGARHS